MAPTTVAPYPDDRCQLPAISVIQAVVRDEIASMGLHPVGGMSAPHFEPDFRPPAHLTQRAPARYPRRNPAEWRTPDDKPICFRCSRVGHVSRYCRSRWVSPPRNGSPDYGSRFFQHGYSADTPRRFRPNPEPQHPNADPMNARRNRSPSPQRRQSRSPQPRRSSPMPDYVTRSSSEN